MSFSSLQDFLCSVGLALIIYSRTFPRWLREHAQERYLSAKETIAIMEAKLKNYQKIQTVLGDLEKEADTGGIFTSPKEELEFKLSLANGWADRNDELLMANAKMEVAKDGLEKCTEEMNHRARESGFSLLLGIGMLIPGIILLLKK